MVANAFVMKNKLAEARRIRERLRCAPPDECARLTERLVKLLDEITD